MAEGEDVLPHLTRTGFLDGSLMGLTVAVAPRPRRPVGNSSMEHTTDNARNVALRMAAVAAFVLAYVGLGVYFQLVLRAPIVYTHIGYVPVVLASLWWGRKGLVVAAILAAVQVAFHLLHLSAGEVWSDATRVAMFFVVGGTVGFLSEKVSATGSALRSSEARYRRLVNESLAGVFVCQEERICFVNPRLCKMLGRGPDELVGLELREMFDEQDRERVRGMASRGPEGGSPDIQYACRLKRGDGSAVWVEQASTLTTYEGKPAVLVCCLDITERKRAEEKERTLTELTRRQEEQLIHSTRLAELGELAAGIAHELNQPLTGIRNFAKNALYMIAHRAGTEAQVSENLTRISNQVDRAAKIISQMRELSRRSDREFTPVDVNRALRESVEFLMPQLRLAEVAVDLQLAEDLPEAMGDRIRIEQVFLNLLANAIQAMDEVAERRLTVRTTRGPGAERPLVVEIADSGVGFAPADAERIFAPFYSTKNPGHGTGLGLSISLTIVRNHNGTIEAIGAPGQGARFVVRLPAAGDAPPEQEGAPRNE